MKVFSHTSLSLVLSLVGILPAYANSEMPLANAFGSYLYVGGEVGAAHSDWSGFGDLFFADNYGVVYGGKMGYQATSRFGAEIGGFILPTSDQSQWVINDFSGKDGSVKSWVGYGAATFRFPLSKNDRFYLRGKVGPAYRSLQHSGALYADTGISNGHYWTAVLGASMNYAFGSVDKPWIIGIEYSNIFGSSDAWSSNGSINANAAPAVQIVALTFSKAFKL